MANIEFNIDNPPLLKDHGIGKIATTSRVYGPTTTYREPVESAYATVGNIKALLPILYKKDKIATIKVQQYWERVAKPKKYGLDQEVTITTSFSTTVSESNTTRELLATSVSASVNSPWASVSAEIDSEIESTVSTQETLQESQSQTTKVTIHAGTTYCAWRLMKSVTITFRNGTYVYYDGKKGFTSKRKRFSFLASPLKSSAEIELIPLVEDVMKDS